MTRPTVFVLNGPNLNLLGKRETEIYGTTTLADIERICFEQCESLGCELLFEQSNHEGALIDLIHKARDMAQCIVINSGAYTHTSVAIRDALAAFDGAVYEVHLSNVYTRESFRHHSYISPVSDGVIAGLGPMGYLAAIQAFTQKL